jgi:hypothetical protein
VWYLALISIQDSAFQAIWRNTAVGLMIGIQTALEKSRKEKDNENQDEREGWYEPQLYKD